MFFSSNWQVAILISVAIAIPFQVGRSSGGFTEKGRMGGF